MAWFLLWLRPRLRQSIRLWVDSLCRPVQTSGPRMLMWSFLQVTKFILNRSILTGKRRPRQSFGSAWVVAFARSSQPLDLGHVLRFAGLFLSEDLVVGAGGGEVAAVEVDC